MDEARSALLGKFREEVDTHLLRLQQNMVTLEENPHDKALLKEVFRSAHTIKGAARMMGFADIARVTHEMESVLAEMRDSTLLLNSDISDLLFEGIEIIAALTQLQARPNEPTALQTLADLNSDRLIERLQAIVKGVTPPVPTMAVSATQGNGHEAGKSDTLVLPAIDPAQLPPVAGGSPSLPLPAESSPRDLRWADDSIRVPIRKLDTLLHLSGEMVITKMQHRSIDDRIHALLERERNRSRHLADLADRVGRSWGSINQADMEAALDQLRALDAQIDTLTDRTLRDFQEYTTRLYTVTDELEDTVLSVRMLPVGTLFDTFPLAIRNFRRDHGKEINLQVQGGDTEIDKQILESLGDPLIHLLRNALDHGIESPAVRQAAGKPARGLIRVAAYPQGTQVVIEISDDGAGMDPARLRSLAMRKNIISRLEAEKLTDDEALNLIYYPGFSTAEIITDMSGRGVGMDVVKTTIERMNGAVSVQSQPGVGTTVILRLPLTLATMQALLVRVGSQVFVLPSHTIEGGMEYVSGDDIFMIENHEVTRIKGRTMPLVRLEELLDLSRVQSGAWLREAGLGHLLPGPGRLPAPPDDTLDEEEDLSLLFQAPALGNGIRLENKLPGVIVGSGDRMTCFLVDELIDELSVVVKSLGPLLGRVKTASGATILGDGRVVMILDVVRLLAEARTRSNSGQLSRAWSAMQPGKRPYILVVDDSITTRELEKSILENAGFEVDIAMDGLEALSKVEAQGQDGRRRYDLMIADIEMPRMDGLELTQRVKTHAQDLLRALPIIIVSSLASETYKQRGVEVGAQAYITKGQFDQSHLLETIDLLIH